MSEAVRPGLLLFLAAISACVRAGFEAEAPASETMASDATSGSDSNLDIAEDRSANVPDAFALPAPIAHWRLDDGAGTAARDASGNGHHGSIVGSVSWLTTGVHGGALRLDGSNNHVSVPYSASLAVQSFTVTAWARLEGSLDERALVRSAGGPGWNGGWRIGTDLSTWHAVLWASQDVYLVGDSPVTGKWEHFALTCDGATVRLYQNTVMVDQQATSGSVSYPSQDPLLIGASNGLNDLQGEVDDVRVYGVALEQQDIVRIFNGES